MRQSFFHCWSQLTVGAGSGGSEDVACGEVAGTQPLTQKRGLRSLAHAGGSQKHEPWNRSLGPRQDIAFGRRSLKPASPIGFSRGSHYDEFMMLAYTLAVMEVTKRWASAHNFASG